MTFKGFQEQRETTHIPFRPIATTHEIRYANEDSTHCVCLRKAHTPTHQITRMASFLVHISHECANFAVTNKCDSQVDSMGCCFSFSLVRILIK